VAKELLSMVLMCCFILSSSSKWHPRSR